MTRPLILWYESFELSIKSERRYIHTADAREFLEYVRGTCQKRIVTEADVFWRARVAWGWVEDYSEEVIPPGVAPIRPRHIPAEDMKPTPDHPYEGRVNPKFIPCLYLASTKDTAIAEVKPGRGCTVTVAEFRPTRILRLADCIYSGGDECEPIPRSAEDDPESIPPPPPPMSEEREGRIRLHHTWRSIDHAFSCPLEPGHEANEYLPTQVIAELFKDEGYDGIVYRSAMLPEGEGFNVALFDLDAASATGRLNLYEVESVKVKCRAYYEWPD